MRKYANMEGARTVFEVMPEKDIVSWSAMIQGYASNGHPKEALDLFYCMQKREFDRLLCHVRGSFCLRQVRGA